MSCLCLFVRSFGGSKNRREKLKLVLGWELEYTICKEKHSIESLLISLVKEKCGLVWSGLGK